ncbi:MAG: hypothetical protein IKW67_00975, partial [Alphaproteobacteria bacterium]|nr:hypothetical protein [Alphaproteobacteria bacterium]
MQDIIWCALRTGGGPHSCLRRNDKGGRRNDTTTLKLRGAGKTSLKLRGAGKIGWDDNVGGVFCKMMCNAPQIKLSKFYRPHSCLRRNDTTSLKLRGAGKTS